MTINESDILVLDPESKITCDHEDIKNWIVKHEGKPAVFDDPGAKADKLGIRVDFRGKFDERYMHVAVKTRIVSWKKFFEIFEKRKLAFVYNKNYEPKDLSLAYKFVPRDAVKDRL